MSKIYTKGGDSGTTSLYGGTRISKASSKVMSYGAVDSANAALGLAAVHQQDPLLADLLRVCQEKLFVVGGELASDPVGRQKLKAVIVPSDVLFLEGVIDELTKHLSQNSRFVLPGASKASAYLHMARTAVRTAEREIIAASEATVCNPQTLKFVNRLSDMLFVLSRYVDEVLPAAQERPAAQPNNQAQPGAFEPAYRPKAHKAIDLEMADDMARSCLLKAESLGVSVVIAVVDEGGHLVLLNRMTDAHIGSIDIAINKAFTSAAFKLETAALANLTGPGQTLYGIQETNQGRVVVFGGGIPFFEDGKVVGAIGISGGTVAEDELIAKEAVKVFEMER